MCAWLYRLFYPPPEPSMIFRCMTCQHEIRGALIPPTCPHCKVGRFWSIVDPEET